MPAGSTRAHRHPRVAVLVAIAVLAIMTIGSTVVPARADAPAVAGVLTNASFEAPQTTGYITTPSGAGWTFTGYAGVQHNGSAYSGSTIAPDGTQTAFLQGAGGTVGTLSQNVTLTAGTYSIAFQAARRYGTVQPVRISIDGTTIGTYTPSTSAFAPLTTATFTVSDGTHAVLLAATDASGDKTTFIDAITISATAGTSGGVGTPAPTAPSAPTGLTAAAGNAQVVLAWNTVAGATSYALYRGTTSGGEGSTPVVTGVTGTTSTVTGLDNGTAYFFTVRAVNSVGTSPAGAEVTATPTTPPGTGTGGTTAGAGVFANPSFELPRTNSYAYAPSGASWTFTGTAGVQQNGSAFSGPTAPDGTQTAFLQGANGTLGTMSQSVALTAGTYSLSFQAARRFGTIQPVRITVDGTVVGTYSPPDSAFSTLTSATFTVGAGTHAVQIAATDSSADKTTFIDAILINGASGTATGTGGGGTGTQAPAPPTGLTAAAGASQVVLTWTASPAATSYDVYRGTSSGKQDPVAVATGVTGTTFTSTGLVNGTAYFFTVRAVNSAGSSASSNEAGATPAAPPTGGSGGGSAVAGVFANASFEAPQTTGYITTPSGAGWTFTGYAGVQHNGSAYSGSTIAPDGTQTAFLQGAGGTVGTLSQNVTLTAGTYSIAFQAARRYGTVQPVRISIDGTTIGTYTPSTSAFAPLTTATFTVSDGTHAVLLAATDASGDKTTFIDAITISSGGSGSPAGGGGGTPTPMPTPTPSPTSTSSPTQSSSPDIDLTGYLQTFSDEFDSLSVATSTPKGPSTWYAYPPYGPAGNYSASAWTADALSTSGGILSNRAYHSGGQWYSGNISSADTTGAGFSQLYGYFEARVKMPDSGVGTWPAFWLSSSTNIPAVSSPVPTEEIDVFEFYGSANQPGDQQPFVQQASHNHQPDGSQNPSGTSFLYSPQTRVPGGAYPWQGFHTYGVKVDPAHITWYIDGVQTNQITTPAAYLTGRFYMMLDYGLGGGYPLDGVVDGSAMQVDWVRAYALPGQ